MRDDFVVEGNGAGRFPGLAPGFVAGFTTRRLAPDSSSIDTATSLLAAALGVPAARCLRARQVHGRAIHVVEPGRSADDGLVGEGDALVTGEPDVLLCVQTADCVPIVLADPETGTLAVVHAGWRGTALRILDATLDLLESRGVRPRTLTAAFGPSISRDRYEVGPEVMSSLAQAYAGVPLDGDESRPGAGDRTLLDVAAYNRAALRRRGVQAIVETGLCTASRPDLLPSYRRDGKWAGRIVTGVLRRPLA